jgi:hypothetical protein
MALPDELAGASAAVVIVTATTAFADGYFTVVACGQERPATSNGDYVDISTIATTVIAPIGENRSACIRTGQAAADVIVDFIGYATD